MRMRELEEKHKCLMNKRERLKEMKEHLNYMGENYHPCDMEKFLNMKSIIREKEEIVEKKIEKVEREMEREMKREMERREKAVRVIQKGCHNWLWKPICNDKTHGINVRLSLRELRIEEQRNREIVVDM